MDLDNLPVTLSTQLQKQISDAPIDYREGILRHAEGVDVLPNNIEMCGLEMMLITSMEREYVMRSFIRELKEDYDYILIVGMPRGTGSSD